MKPTCLSSTSQRCAIRLRPGEFGSQRNSLLRPFIPFLLMVEPKAKTKMHYGKKTRPLTGNVTRWSKVVGGGLCSSSKQHTHGHKRDVKEFVIHQTRPLFFPLLPGNCPDTHFLHRWYIQWWAKVSIGFLTGLCRHICIRIQTSCELQLLGRPMMVGHR